MGDAIVNIEIKNLSSNYHRQAWVDVTVPGSVLLDGEENFVLEPQGWRVVKGREIGKLGTLLHVRSMVDKKGSISGELKVNLDISHLPAKFRLSNWVADDIVAIIPFPVVATEPEVSFPEEGLPSDFHRVDLKEAYDSIKLVESNPALQVYHLRAKVQGTLFTWDCWMYLYADQDVVPFDWVITSFDPQKGVEQRFNGIFIECGEWVSIEYGYHLGVRTPRNREGKWVVPLMGKGVIGTGQQIGYMGNCHCLPSSGLQHVLGAPDEGSSGRMASLMAAAQGPLVACVGRGDWNGSWLAYGKVPRLPWNAKGGSGEVLQLVLEQEHTRFMGLLSTRGNYFDDRPRGLAKFAGRTGDQEDFGATKGSLTVSTGDPLYIYQAMFAGISSHMRPIHYLESDGSPIKSEDHPDWHTWTQVTDHRLGSDLLGIPQAPSGWVNFGNTNGYFGADDQHFSHLNEAAAYALCPRFAIRRMIQDRTENFEAGHPVELSGGSLATRLGAPRAAGRTLQTLVNDWLVTGDPKIERIILARFDNAFIPNWLGANVAGPVKPWGLIRDVRTLLDSKGGAVWNWSVWEHGLLAAGLGAAMRHFSDQRPMITEITKQICNTVVSYGMFFDQGRWQLAGNVAWIDDGQPLQPSDYSLAVAGKNSGLLTVSNMFWRWVYAAPFFLKEILQAEGISTPEDQALVDRCSSILDQNDSADDWRDVEWKAY